MNRIMIIGSPGAGKTTLALRLSEKLGLPLVHLDALYWRDNWQSISNEEFDRLLMVELCKQKWIMDGNFGRTIPLRLAYCDTVIYLDYSKFTCVFGIMKRVAEWHGKTRPDMGKNCPEHVDLDFLKFAWTFHKKHNERYMKILKEADNKKVIILKNRKQAEKFIQSIS